MERQVDSVSSENQYRTNLLLKGVRNEIAYSRISVDSAMQHQ